MTQQTANRFWDKHYRNFTQRRVNPVMVEIASGLAPATALDLGCGGGGDTLWLARAGWRVTAVDLSATATARLAEAARELGLDHLVHAERHDLASTFPDGSFDLVTALYFHSPFDLPRARVLRTAARALTPGGRLLVVDHGSIAPVVVEPGSRRPPPHAARGRRRPRARPGRLVDRAGRLTPPDRHRTGWSDGRGRGQRPVDKGTLVKATRRRDRRPPRTGTSEKDVLLGFLDYLRACVAAKVEGVAEPQVRTPGVASGTNLLGLVNHLTHVERATLLGERVTDWQATFRAAPIAPSLRWALTHLIEETGRHAGHADILRELIDGTTGR